MRRGLLALALVGCGSPPPTPVPRAGGASVAVAPRSANPAKWVPGRDFHELGDGRRGAVFRHRRVILEGLKTTTLDDGPIDVGEPHQMPEALGGGWVFVDSGTVAWSKTFDGELVTMPAGARSRHFGFGVGIVNIEGKQYELSTGERVAPPIPGTSELFGLRSGHVALGTSSGDAYLSVAKGRPFEKVASDVFDIGYDGRTFVLLSRTVAPRRLSLDGRVGPPSPDLRAGQTVNLLELDRRPPPVIEEIFGLGTIALGDTHILAIHDRDLAVYDAVRGVRAPAQRDVFRQTNCHPIRGGRPAFVGCDRATEMDLYRIEAADEAPVLERTIPFVSASFDFRIATSATALAFARGCDGSPAALGTYCVRHDARTWNVFVTSPPALTDTIARTVSVVPTSDAAPYGFAWRDEHEALVVADSRTRAIRTIPFATLPDFARAPMSFRATTVSGGRMRILVEGDHPGLLTIDASGRVEGQALEGHLGAVGPRALLLAPDGKPRETLDAGETWEVVESPDLDPRTQVRCINDAGCELRPWFRLGWGR